MIIFRQRIANIMPFLKQFLKKERELLGISRQQAIKNNIYTFLLQKREETALSFASAVADSRIIDPAESGDIPVSPKRKFIYLGAILTAIILGIVWFILKIFYSYDTE